MADLWRIRGGYGGNVAVITAGISYQLKENNGVNGTLIGQKKANNRLKRLMIIS